MSMDLTDGQSFAIYNQQHLHMGLYYSFGDNFLKIGSVGLSCRLANHGDIIITPYTNYSVNALKST